MAESYAQHNESSQAFHKWRNSAEAQLSGIGGLDLETIRMFIPRSNLEKYFEKPRRLEDLLDGVLSSDQRPAVDVNYIRNNYLQSFATLLCIGKGSLIHHFRQHPSLRDCNMPYHTRPDEFPFLTPDIFEEFKNAQWQFCASKLEYSMNVRFKEDCILPIILKEKIGEGGSAIIYKIVVDESYNSLLPPGDARLGHRLQHKNTFVLKTYRAAEAEQNYKAESEAYMKLRWGEKPTSHIITYYGGFVHGNSHNIILEYADRGTLENFMRRTDRPSTFRDTLMFWKRFVDVTHGIMTIHGKIGNESSASQLLNGLHQDIKPANILVFGANGTSPYDCHFKIADLGLTRFKPVSQQNDPSDLDAFGTRAYGAPETFRSHVATESSPLKVTPAVDIWSIGCVFSEVAVWANDGWDRLAEYRRRRSIEVANKGGGVGEYVFHFEGNLLDAVKDIHGNILGKRMVENYTTRSILDRHVSDMLQPETRPQAKLVCDKLWRQIKEIEDKFDTSVGLEGNFSGEPTGSKEAGLKIKSRSQISPDYTHGPSQLPPERHNGPRAERKSPRGAPLPPADDFAPSSSSISETSLSSHQHRSTSQREDPRGGGVTETPQTNGDQAGRDGSHSPLGVSTAESTHQNSDPQHVQRRQDELVRPTLSIKEGLDWKRRKKHNENVVLPGVENLTNLHQRDHIFLIDNSATMDQHRNEIIKVVSLLAYMLKASDKDGLDMYFTQNTHKVNSQKSSKLSSSIYGVHFVGISDMRGRLQNVLQEHRVKFGALISPPRRFFRRQSPQPQRPLSFYILTDAKWQPTDVEGLIKDLVGDMRGKGCPKEHVAIQFIRFGDDPASIQRLDGLDHGLGLNAMGMDIVDHTLWDGNVWKQLLGALNDWYDDDPPENI